MEKDHKLPNGITLHHDKPTNVTIKALFRWVIWQFPQSKNGRVLGAVHPPTDQAGWYPALLDLTKKQISIFGHLPLFEAPEDVCAYLSKQEQP